MKIEQPPLTACCSTCNARKHWKQKKRKKKKNNFLCIFRYVSLGICLISMDELPFTFSLPKTDSLKQMSFSLFFLGTRGHFITFSINTTGLLCFIFYSQDYLNWLTTDILQLFSVMQILTAGVGKGHYFQSIHTCLLQSGAQTGCRATWPFQRWHFIKTIFSGKYGWVPIAFRSIVPCVHMGCKVSALPYKLHSSVSFSLHHFLCLPLLHVSLDNPLVRAYARKRAQMNAEKQIYSLSCGGCVWAGMQISPQQRCEADKTSNWKKRNKNPVLCS